jgi:hypothetical protein
VVKYWKQNANSIQFPRKVKLVFMKLARAHSVSFKMLQKLTNMRVHQVIDFVDIKEDSSRSVHLAVDDFYAEDTREITPPPPIPERFDIEFEVPCGSYTRDLVANNRWTWSLFTDNVALIMDCHTSSLMLGFVLPWKIKSNQKTTPKILDSTETFEKLITDIQTWRDEQRLKSKGKEIKVPAIRLHNLRPEKEHPTMKGPATKVCDALYRYLTKLLTMR